MHVIHTPEAHAAFELDQYLTAGLDLLNFHFED
jgi:hypothetical protein